MSEMPRDMLGEGPEKVCSGVLPPAVRKEFTFPGDLDSLVASREKVMDFIRQCGCEEADEIDLMLAVHEALANAALHGCGNDTRKSIWCAVEIEPSSVCIIVRDPGPGFDVRIADPDHFETTTLENGRGIALMRGMVDEVAFARSGSEVRLLKRTTCTAAGSQVQPLPAAKRD